MSNRSIPAGKADQSAADARTPVTLISTPWIRLVSSRRAQTAEPLPIPHARDRAA
jgi:hypothetical protein